MAKEQATARFPKYKLQTESERAALDNLKPSWGGRKHRRLFHQAVQVHLALIEALASSKLSKNERVSQSFRRRAEMIRHFVTKMQKPMKTELALRVAKRLPSSPPPSGWSSFPARELLRYAISCENYANSFAGQPHHATSPQNTKIVELLNFVRLHTGKAHLKELAVLLKRPCGDDGLTPARLDQLLRSHAKQSALVRHDAEQARHGIAALVTSQALGTLPKI
jgi:hypothetical protein